jgi:hypothetical protein
LRPRLATGLPLSQRKHNIILQRGTAYWSGGLYRIGQVTHFPTLVDRVEGSLNTKYAKARAAQEPTLAIQKGEEAPCPVGQRTTPLLQERRGALKPLWPSLEGSCIGHLTHF